MRTRGKDQRAHRSLPVEVCFQGNTVVLKVKDERACLLQFGQDLLVLLWVVCLWMEPEVLV